jgi:antitoxin VapB
MSALTVQPTFAPIAALQECVREEANACLVAWGHQDGAILRPIYGVEHYHVLVHEGRPVAVAVTSPLIPPHVGPWTQMHRGNTCELSRLCAARRDLCRVMLRLWREFVFPALPYAHAVSAQNLARHTGDLYRFDGWTPMHRTSSGTDARSGRRGARKQHWGWALPADVVAELRAERAKVAA